MQFLNADATTNELQKKNSGNNRIHFVFIVLYVSYKI